MKPRRQRGSARDRRQVHIYPAVRKCRRHSRSRTKRRRTRMKERQEGPRSWRDHGAFRRKRRHRRQIRKELSEQVA